MIARKYLIPGCGLLLLLVAAQPVFGQPSRIWTDVTGKLTLEGKVVGGDKQGIRLKKTDGETVKVRFDQMSKDDRETAAEDLETLRTHQVWRREMKQLGELMSMSYRIDDRGYGVQSRDHEYLKKAAKFSYEVLENEQLNAASQAMCRIVAEMVHWHRVDSGWENPEPLTPQQIERRMKSMDDAFNAGAGDEDAIASSFAHGVEIFQELGKNKFKAQRKLAELNGNLAESWESLCNDFAAHSGPVTDQQLISFQLEITFEKRGVLGRPKHQHELRLVNQSGPAMRNALIRVHSRYCSESSGPKTWYFYVSRFTRAKPLILPDEIVDSIFGPGYGPSWGGEAGSLLQPKESETVFEVSIWCDELQRENIEVVATGTPELTTETITEKFAAMIRTREIKKIACEFEEK